MTKLLSKMGFKVIDVAKSNVFKEFDTLLALLASTQVLPKKSKLIFDFVIFYVTL